MREEGCKNISRGNWPELSVLKFSSVSDKGILELIKHEWPEMKSMSISGAGIVGEKYIKDKERQ